VAESGFEAVLEPEPRRLYNVLSDEDRLLLDDIFRDIEASPYPDGQRKLPLASAPDLVAVYRHSRWWVLYRLAEPGHIAIDAIGPALSPTGQA